MASPLHGLLPLPPRPPFLLPAHLARHPDSPALTSFPLGMGGAVLLRVRKFALKYLTELVSDRERLKRWWYAVMSGGAEGRRLASPPVPVPVRPVPVPVPRPFIFIAGEGARRFLYRLMVRLYTWSVVMAAAAVVAAGLLLTYGARRGARGDGEDEPRHLPLEVRRNLRVMTYRLLPPKQNPLPRWPQQAAPVPRSPAAVGLPRSPAAVGNITENVNFAVPLVHGPLATPIGTWSSPESPVLRCSDLLMYTEDKGGPKKKTEEVILRMKNSFEALTKTSKECQGSLKTEYAKFEATHDKFHEDEAAHNFKGKENVTLYELEETVLEKIVETDIQKFKGSLERKYTKFEVTNDKFCKDKAAHVQNFKDLFSKFEVQKEELTVQYELQRRKEKVTLSELEKTVSAKTGDVQVQNFRDEIDLDKACSKRMNQLHCCLDALKTSERNERVTSGLQIEKMDDAQVCVKKLKQGR